MSRIAVFSFLILLAAIVAVYLVRSGSNDQSDRLIRSESQPTATSASETSPADHHINASSPSSGRAESVASSDSAFRSIDPGILSQVEPTVQARYFKRGPPRNYVRHRILEIDTEQFKAQLSDAWDTWTEKQEIVSLPLPLFADTTITVTVTGWFESDSGSTSASGAVVGYDDVSSHAKFHFTDNGHLQGIINLGGGGYLIDLANAPPNYVVFQLELGDTPLVID